MTRSLLFARAFTKAELQQIKEDCKMRILSGQGQMAFVSSSVAAGRSASMLQNYSADDLLEIVLEALDIVAGTATGQGVTYASYGGTY